jgi:hypothetical protein
VQEPLRAFDTPENRGRGTNNMKTVLEIMESLITLQAIQLTPGRQTSAVKEEIAKLRSDVPEGILGHFDRLLARRKKGVAIARNNVCSECHLKISSGTWANLSHRRDIHLCESCGRYLHLPPQNPTDLPQVSSPSPKVTKSHGKAAPSLV